MNNLIRIEKTTLNNELTQTVNARELHSFLMSKQEFANWIKDRINQYGFTEGQDFLIILSKTPNGGRPSKEYHISIDMAKELSMVEKNEKGREARQYFIDCEKKAKQISVPQTLPDALRLAADLAEQNQTLVHQVEELQPKAEFHDKVSKAPDALTLAEAAKTLGTGRNRLCAFLRQNGWLRRNNEPYQDKINQGLLDVKLSNWEHPELGIQQAVTSLVTGKGLAKLSQMLSMGVAA